MEYKTSFLSFHFSSFFSLYISPGEGVCKRSVNSSLGTSRGSTAGRTLKGCSVIPIVLIHLGEDSQRKDRRVQLIQRRGRSTGKRIQLSGSMKKERKGEKKIENEQFLGGEEMKKTEGCPC